MSDFKGLFFCRHCQEKTLGTVVFRINGKEDIIEELDIIVESYYFLVRCGTCSEFSLLNDYEGNDGDGGLCSAQILFPSSKEENLYIPKPLYSALKETKRAKRATPIAFILLIRRCLELICNDKSASGKNLYDKILDLSNKGVIPGTLSEMAAEIRLFGNAGAHDADVEVSYDQKDILEDFLSAIIEYVYIAPKKLNKLRDTLKESAATSPKEKRDE